MHQYTNTHIHNHKPYHWILFDADNTILDFDRSEREALRKALAELSIPFENNYHQAYHRINKDCWLAFEEGKISRAELRLRRFELFFKEIGQSAECESFATRYLFHLSQTDFLVDGAIAQLRRLAPRYQLALVTNGLKEVQRPRISKAGLNEFFPTIIVSDEIGHSKPNPSFFEYTFEQIGHPPREKVLIVGDNLNADIRGGAEFGIHTCWYNPAGQENGLGVSPNYEINQLQKLSSFL
ncbi:MAG: YjjG family noncanonical pyrimidine nucleotidase [Phaeodactylibacter sp.]|nr:YjjG family noncanonical pyrimidine nucleotidase [Phaeodactylibacter sp.]MCB9286975.1 noncanonical pyrimidine nucleotidase, YjjG family [Lewinellaceae bacterium]